VRLEIFKIQSEAKLEVEFETWDFRYSKCS